MGSGASSMGYGASRVGSASSSVMPEATVKMEGMVVGGLVRDSGMAWVMEMRFLMVRSRW